jgi:hypothetical protein
MVEAQKAGQKAKKEEYLETIKYKKRINKQIGRKIEEKVKGICHRQIGGTSFVIIDVEWIDPSMVDWPDDDHRIFAGNLGNEVSDEALSMAFNRYPSFIKAKVVRDGKSGKSKGYGFVSFGNPDDYVRAMKDMDGHYVGKRPLRLTKSDWKKRFTTK